MLDNIQFDFLSIPKKQNIYYKQLNIFRLLFMMMGQWPYQRKMYNNLLLIYQLIINVIFFKGQVSTSSMYILYIYIYIFIYFDVYRL